MVAVALKSAPVVGPEPEPVPRQRVLSPRQTQRREQVVASLTEPEIIAEEDRLLERQYYGVTTAFQPRNSWQDWLSARIATLIVRINRSERIERKLRAWASYRAFDFWEDDQRLAVLELAGRLARDPARVVPQLRQTPAGVDYLVERWQTLARLDAAAWTDETIAQARQLLGGDESASPNTPGFATARAAELEADRTRIGEADALLRGLVEADLSDAHVPNLARLRREVRAWHRQLKWYVDQFHVEHPDRWDDPMRRPASANAPRDSFRARNLDHFDGVPRREPIITPVPNVVDVAEPELTTSSDETKPSVARDERQTDETNPIDPGLVPAPTDATRPAMPVAIHDYATEKGRHHSRTPQPGEPSREYARDLKRARRRTNLALAELV